MTYNFILNEKQSNVWQQIEHEMLSKRESIGVQIFQLWISQHLILFAV